MPVSIEVLPIGQVTVAARAWKHRGRRLVTAIVKVTCLMRTDQPMVVTTPLPIEVEERHLRGNPVASLVRASDLALLVPEPEVVVVGSAFSAPGRPVPHTAVRLAVQRGTTMLINKRLEVFGDRRAAPGGSPSEPAPFEEMPIQYERALGGMASRDNPVGRGMAVEADGMLALPNIELPGGRGAQPAGFGPLPSAWPARQRRRGSLSWTAANQALEVELPDDFDDAYFQTAPADQRTRELTGGDLIAIVNMHPDLPMLRSYVPRVRGVALAQTAGGARHEMQLRLDTIHLEPRLERAELVFRGATMLAEEELDGLRIAGSVETDDARVEFPDLSTLVGLVTRSTPERTADLGSTDVIEPATAAQPALRTHGGTLVMEERPRPVIAKPVASLAGKTEPHPFTRTVDIGDPLPPSLPFDAEAAPPGASPVTVVATPWDERSSEPTAPVLPAAAARGATVPLPSALPKLGDDAAEAKGPAASSAAVSSDALPTPRRDAPARDEPPAPPPAPAPGREPKKDVRADLYRKLKR